MKDSEILVYLDSLKTKYNVRIYTPIKYFEGLLTKTQIHERFLEMVRRRDEKTFQKFQTDEIISKPNRESIYTQKFYKVYGKHSKSLLSKSLATGVPMVILQTIYKRGLAAWKSGHRVGATQQQWGFARVHSFLMFGCTIFGPDFDMFQKACVMMTKTKLKIWIGKQDITCPKSKFKTSAYFQKRLDNYNYIMKLKNIS
jgi:hypothetical protein